MGRWHVVLALCLLPRLALAQQPRRVEGSLPRPVAVPLFERQGAGVRSAALPSPSAHSRHAAYIVVGIVVGGAVGYLVGDRAHCDVGLVGPRAIDRGCREQIDPRWWLTVTGMAVGGLLGALWH